jgi:hypothetical protein
VCGLILSVWWSGQFKSGGAFKFGGAFKEGLSSSEECMLNLELGSGGVLNVAQGD